MSEEEIVNTTKEAYDRLTRMFNDFDFHPKDAPEAYSELTEARCMLENGWKFCDRLFVGQLMHVIECFIDHTVSTNRLATGNPTVQGEGK